MKKCYYGHNDYPKKHQDCPVCEHERDESRRQADNLISLAERLGYSDAIKVSSSCPDWLTIGHMRHYIEPSYNAEINGAIMLLTMRCGERSKHE